MARPSLLTPKVRRTIVAAIRDGHPFEAACELAGIAPSTAYEWCARGEGRDPRRQARKRYRQFAEAVARADGTAGTFGDEDELATPPPSTKSQHDARFAEPSANSGYNGLNRPFVDPQNGTKTAPALPANPSESQRDVEFAESEFPDTRDRARAREQEARRAPMPWVSQRSRRDRSVIDEEF